jgi:succinate-semialdehyde dehydrogenase/glutarate-semialdehyde dehydrogenase
MAAIGLIQGAFENAGQMCISIERVYVEEAAYEPLLRSLKRYIQDVKIGAGPGMDIVMGSMTNQAEFDRTREHIQDALDKGARLLYGGNPLPDKGALFHEPTILVDVDHSMLVMQEETFGPLLPIMKVHSADEAVRLANKTDYGLSASIFSRNLQRAEQLAQRINSGDVSVNRAQFVTATPSLPSGGQKQSGTGRRNGPEGLLKYTATQSVLLDNLIGAEKSVSLTNDTVLTTIGILRKIRRYVPFI